MANSEPTEESPEPATTKPTRKQLKALWDVVVAWRDDNKVSCSESLAQVDSISEELPDLAEKALDIVGYWEEET